VPCDMDRIVQICNQHKIFLFEDCSHAHGALYQGKPVGSFGDAAAWSLQGQKIVTGGEGGILLTDNKKFFDRALLLGHYNKRCKTEISPDSDLYKYAITGFGLKNRAHPLAIAMAHQQFQQLESFLQQKRIYAQRMITKLSSIPFLTMPKFDSDAVQPSWYAFVMNFNAAKANGVTIEDFESALLAEGLVEIDRPGSTRPIHDYPLFTSPEDVSPALYRPQTVPQTQFPRAEQFCATALKLPVWAFSDESAIVDAYIEGIQKVSEVVITHPEVLIGISKKELL